MSDIPVITGFFQQVGSDRALIVDSTTTPQSASQVDLKDEVQSFDEIQNIDHAYCMDVEGSSQETNLWISRNQNNSGFAESDLHRFKNIAWNECIVKKYLSNKEGNATLIGQSMINIIRTLNLQWRSFQVMGLHPKIESAEKQVVMHVMERGLIEHTTHVGQVSRAFRRCKHFSAFFANAVGGQLVANSGRTPGLAKTMYGQDLDYAYRNKNLYFFESALQRYSHLVHECLEESDHVDYIARLSELKIVAPNSDVQLDVPASDQQRPVILPQTTHVVSSGGSFGADGYVGAQRVDPDAIADAVVQRIQGGALNIDTTGINEAFRSLLQTMDQTFQDFITEQKTEVDNLKRSIQGATGDFHDEMTRNQDLMTRNVQSLVHRMDHAGDALSTQISSIPPPHCIHPSTIGSRDREF
jgi:hypothetical protein